MKGGTVERDLRTGRPLWADSGGLGVPTLRPTAPLEVDVAVIGAGVSGAFMAHNLAQDFTVVVLEREVPLFGSTIASTALLQWELDLPVRALSELIGEAKAARVYRRSRRAVVDLVEIVRSEHIACGLEPKSSLYLAGDAYGARALKQEAGARSAIGLESVFLDAAALRERFDVERTGAILSEGSASADPARLAAGLLRRAARSGARIYAPVEVTGVLQGKNHVTLVNSAGIEIRARHVVYCCGYDFPKGVPTHRARIISTWALASKPIRDMPAWLAEHLVWEASDPYLYFRTTGDSRLVIGGEDEPSPDRHADPSALAAKGRAITRKLKALLPALDFEIDYAWAGAFGQSTTSMPLIGAVPDMSRCFAAMGFGGNGITYSVMASQIVGAAIRGRDDPDADLYQFQ